MRGDMLQGIMGRRAEDSQARGKHENPPAPRAGQGVLASIGEMGKEPGGVEGKWPCPQLVTGSLGPGPGPCHGGPAP